MQWFAPRIDNPAYIGVWKPAQIANPNFFEDKEPHAMAPIGGIGIELWTMQVHHARRRPSRYVAWLVVQIASTLAVPGAMAAVTAVA